VDQARQHDLLKQWPTSKPFTEIALPICAIHLGAQCYIATTFKSETSMQNDTIAYDDFAKVDIRIGRIVTVRPFERARNPSYKVEVEFGEIGRKWSSAQITSYSADELVGKLVACVVNMPPRNIAGFQSEILILGARDNTGTVKVLTPTHQVGLGEQVF
jgi:tRNA-binding protein